MKGALGAAIVVAVYLAGAWTYSRWQEFKVMRAVTAQILEARQAQQPRQSPAPQPEGVKK